MHLFTTVIDQNQFPLLYFLTLVYGKTVFILCFILLEYPTTPTKVRWHFIFITQFVCTVFFLFACIVVVVT